MRKREKDRDMLHMYDERISKNKLQLLESCHGGRLVECRIRGIYVLEGEGPAKGYNILGSTVTSENPTWSR